MLFTVIDICVEWYVTFFPLYFIFFHLSLAQLITIDMVPICEALFS